jgi:hypothetical protein
VVSVKIIFTAAPWFLVGKGFNPKIKFKRTQTIMEGAPYCDFRYTLED